MAETENKDLKVKKNGFFRSRISGGCKAMMAAVLGILGFNSCEVFNVRCEYGVPHSDYNVSGTLTDSEEKPIKNIRVTQGIWYGGEYYAVNDTLYTGSNGKFDYQIDEMNNLVPQFFYFDDIDGEENGGKFKRDSISFNEILQNKRQTKKGDNNWYSGEFYLPFTKTLTKEDNE